MGKERCNRSLNYKSILVSTTSTSLLAHNGPTSTLSLFNTLGLGILAPARELVSKYKLQAPTFLTVRESISTCSQSRIFLVFSKNAW